VIESITVLGTNGSQVQLNLADNVYTIETFDVTYDARSDDTDRVQEHGTWPAFDYIETMHVSIEGKINANNAGDYWAKRRTFLAPFTPVPEKGIRTTCRLLAAFTDFPEVVQLDCNLDGSRPAVPMTVDIPAVTQYQINLKARDPRWLGELVQTLSLGIPASGAPGFTVPFTLPITLTGGNSPVNSVMNAGDVVTYPDIIIPGPCSDPSLTVFRPDGSSEQWALQNIFIPQGQVIEADFQATTVILNGQFNLYSKLAPSSVWWRLDPGINQVEYNAVNTTTDTPPAQINWQNAYML
jgi:hypothetical protein